MTKRILSSAVFAACAAELGPPDTVANIAGAAGDRGIEHSTDEDLDRYVELNLGITFRMCREAVAVLGEGGSIVNIAATYAWTGGPGTAASAAAKAGVVNLTQSLAVEWAPWNIRVNAIAPGLFPHDDHVAAMRRARPQGYAAEADRIPAGRTGEVREIGWATALLCSPYMSYVTGHTLVVDGGNWLRRGLRMPKFVSVEDQIAQMTAEQA